MLKEAEDDRDNYKFLYQELLKEKENINEQF